MQAYKVFLTLPWGNIEQLDLVARFVCIRLSLSSLSRHLLLAVVLLLDCIHNGTKEPQSVFTSCNLQRVTRMSSSCYVSPAKRCFTFLVE